MLVLDEDGAVTQTATGAFFFVVDGTLHTPSAGLSVHPGIMRWFALEIADELGVPTETGRYGLEAIASADEAFIANNRWEIRPVDTIDGARYAEDGDVTRAIAEAYDHLVDSRHY